ncbi:MAG: hypothetical protein LC744_05840 [Chloroflexi bacterium]|nr:hypothetical protein [Chloroflexota bacterium]
MTQPSTRERPLGVTILAILAAVGGILGLLGSVALLGLFSAAGGLFMILGLVSIVLSVLYLVFAYGAWTLQPWGWTLGVGLAAASVALTLIGLTQGTQELVGALISLAIAGVILYYLFQPDVKAAFGRP